MNKRKKNNKIELIWKYNIKKKQKYINCRKKKCEIKRR